MDNMSPSKGKDVEVAAKKKERNPPKIKHLLVHPDAVTWENKDEQEKYTVIYNKLAAVAQVMADNGQIMKGKEEEIAKILGVVAKDGEFKSRNLSTTQHTLRRTAEKMLDPGFLFQNFVTSVKESRKLLSKEVVEFKSDFFDHLDQLLKCTAEEDSTV